MESYLKNTGQDVLTVATSMDVPLSPEYIGFKDDVNGTLSNGAVTRQLGGHTIYVKSLFLRGNYDSYLKELGNPPSKDEAVKLEAVLASLNKTKIGQEICKSFGSGGCAWDNLKSAKVEITTRDLRYHLPEPLESIISLGFASTDLVAAAPRPSKINGRTIVCIDKELISNHYSRLHSYFFVA